MVPRSGSISVTTLVTADGPMQYNRDLTLSTFDNTVKVQGLNNNALVTVANIKAGAAIIHIIDAVLVPTLPETTHPTYPTIAAAATAYGLTTLVSVVSMTPLLNAVTDGRTSVTLLAPTNDVRLIVTKDYIYSVTYLVDIYIDIATSANLQTLRPDLCFLLRPLLLS